MHDESKDARVCARCKKPELRVWHTTVHMLNGLPTGSVYELRCAACGAELTLESAGRAVFSCLASIPFLFMGMFFVAGMASWLAEIAAGEASLPTRDRAFISVLFGAFFLTGIWLVTKTIVRVKRARANPIAPTGP